jgi:hypothetical protein
LLAGSCYCGKKLGPGAVGWRCCRGPSAAWPTFARRERKKKSAIPVKSTRDTKTCSGPFDFAQGRRDDGAESGREKIRTLKGARRVDGVY